MAKMIKTHSTIRQHIGGLSFIALCLYGMAQTPLFAQETVILNIQAQINNAFSLNEAGEMGFGLISISTQAGFAPALTIATNGDVTVTGTGGNANIVVLGNQNPSSLAIDASPAFADATINMQLTGVTALTGTGPSSFTIGNFTYDDQQGNSGALPMATPVDVTLDGVGQALVLIGSTITSASGGSYGQGTYTGTFTIETFF